MKNIIIFCYRLIEFRNLLTSNVIKECSELMNVVVVVPRENIHICRKIVGNKVKIEPLNGSAKFSKKEKLKNYEKFENILRNILSLTFAKKKLKTKCISQDFMIKAYFNSQKNLGMRKLIQAKLIIFSARLLSNSLILRKLLLKLISLFLKK